MDARKDSHVFDHDKVCYGKVWLWKGYVPQKYPMNFLLLNNIWTTTFLLTLMNTTKLYSWCSVRVEKEGIQIVEQAIGSVWIMCQGIGQTSNLKMVRYMT
jgi:hypothetical protein